MKNLGIEKAFLQTYKGEFATEATFVAFMGCEELQIPIEKFDYNDIGTLDIQKNTIVLGGITAVRHALTVLGITPPAPIDIPDELKPFTKRDIQIGTIKYFMEQNKFPLFVKPTKPKLFTGMVVSSKDELQYLSAFDMGAEESEIITSSVVNFLSEYRVFVIDKKIVDCRRYAGDYKVVPDFKFIEETIENYKTQPISYAIDFGVIPYTQNGFPMYSNTDGYTALIEVNDGYSIGSYGLNHRDYVNLCMLRWNQIINN